VIVFQPNLYNARKSIFAAEQWFLAGYNQKEGAFGETMAVRTVHEIRRSYAIRLRVIHVHFSQRAVSLSVKIESGDSNPLPTQTT
jgi:hypothetical protein